MDFELRTTQQKEPWQFTQFNDLIEQIREQLAYWNNFGSHEPVRITIKKVKGSTETVGVNVSETIDSKDIFGGS